MIRRVDRRAGTSLEQSNAIAADLPAVHGGHMGRVRHSIGAVTNRGLHRFGLELRTLDAQPRFTLEQALSRARARGVEVATIIDVGASNGVWSEIALKHWPQACDLLIEANPVHETALEVYVRGHVRSEYVLAAAGDEVGELFFDARDALGGNASHDRRSEDLVSLPATTVDHEVETRRLPAPFLLKLDTHGFEVPILEGARRTLEHASLLVIEAYNFDIEVDSLRFWELCSFLEERGFRTIDLCDLMLRPRDQSFWQVDLFFVPALREEFASHTYR
jgi:FkbM family methyltransferase